MMRSPMHIVKQMSNMRDQSYDYTYGLPNYTRRFKYILNNLIDNNVQFIIDNFKDDYGYFNNLYVPVNGLEHERNLYFMAHHDVYETVFENANDNTASIAILLSLIHIFNNIENLNYNLIFVFTDSEERGFKGAKRLVYQLDEGYFSEFKTQHIINLELCGVGDTLWIEDNPESKFLHENIKWHDKTKVVEVNCPINDAKYIRNTFLDYQNATTIGILNTDEVGNLDKKPWGDIHTARDTVDKLSEKDMNNLTMVLNNLIIDLNQK